MCVSVSVWKLSCRGRPQLKESQHPHPPPGAVSKSVVWGGYRVRGWALASLLGHAASARVDGSTPCPKEIQTLFFMVVGGPHQLRWLNAVQRTIIIINYSDRRWSVRVGVELSSEAKRELPCLLQFAGRAHYHSSNISISISISSGTGSSVSISISSRMSGCGTLCTWTWLTNYLRGISRSSGSSNETSASR